VKKARGVPNLERGWTKGSQTWHHPPWGGLRAAARGPYVLYSLPVFYKVSYGD